MSARAERATRARTQHSRPQRTGARIAALAVSDSDTVLTQDDVLDRLRLKGNEFAERIFARCGVRERHLDLGDELMDLTLQGRAARIEEDLLRHSVRAVDALGVDARSVATVVSSSLYSLACPTLAHRLVEHCEMDPATDKYHVDGVGCASGVPLMRLAAQTLGEDPSKHALVVAAESMSGILTRATPDEPRAKIVGSAIFGDGCAAAVLSRDPHADGPIILDSQVHQLPETRHAVSLTVTESDGYLHLARELPDLAGAGLGAVADAFLARNGIGREQIDHWMIHPGGRRIIECAQSALGLSDADAETSWLSLADHGNIGTPSIFYVLKDTIEQREPGPGERGLLVTIGPGVTLGLMLLGW